ncbi:InlB B-repeat-containing protein [Blautia obeum]|uniref:InlB B-repeat-containing protein n=1 Tax=Blautia obeum TaxID=40520 RepID=UPI001D0682D7|nr:InlB B-repeat-containing protein [Blautia obeum]MCB7340966.1 InlB B-repeat-containing protein [Blautia obeum]
MRKATVNRWRGIIFLTVLFGFLLLAASRPVSAQAATTEKCKVVFANSNGVVSNDTFRKWTRTVTKGSYIQLPTVNRSGYKCVWVEKSGTKELKYATGRNVRITKNTKFCLRYYKLYTVRYYTMNGSKEYTSLREQGYQGQVLTFPLHPTATGYKFLGWSTSINGKTVKKEGDSLRVTGNMKFYIVGKKITGVNLRKYDGTVWKVVDTSSRSATFPAVNLNSANMCLGWSRTKGKTTNPEYKAGDKIPTRTGNYYMVVFFSKQDRAPASIIKPTKHRMVYFVGDSRTVGLQLALGNSAPSNVDFVCKGNQGLDWFRQTGYRELLRKLSKQSRKTKKAVIINLGVNDMSNINTYVVYMRKVSENLKQNYNCDMYYLSVNPVNSAMIRSYGAGTRTEAQVAAFNKTIYQKLCSGSDRAFIYINTCTNLQKYGWSSNRYDAGIYDGLHYSVETTLRIYGYCIRKLNA